MKDRPILFKGEMVRAILEGKKTQTRRVLKLQPERTQNDINPRTGKSESSYFVHEGCVQRFNPDKFVDVIKCPYGKVGDKLWVRETWLKSEGQPVRYRASTDISGAKWKPSIFMPRKYSRVTLEIVDIRVERVQDITYIEAKEEGINYEKGYSEPVEVFERLWDSINGKKEDCSWGDNPWVWVVEFKKENTNEK